MAEKIQLVGTVVSAMPGTVFKVKLDKIDREIIATLSGKLRMNYIRIVQGDKVTVELSEYDLTRGRIVWRNK